MIFRTDDVAAAEAYIAELGWKVDSATGVIEVPSNPDNTVTSTVVQENIKLPRKHAFIVAVDYTLTTILRTVEDHLPRDAGCMNVVASKACSIHVLPDLAALVFLYSVVMALHLGRTELDLRVSTRRATRGILWCI